LNAIIEARNLVKNYAAGDASIPVLRGVSFDVSPGEFVAIVGPSGNGKTTLLNMITGIDHPTSGAIHVNGQLLDSLTEDQLAEWRGRSLGIVFQFFQLLPALSLVQNVILPMDFMGTIPARQRRARALALLEQVGLADQADKLPSAVSGGQQQRAAIARALANDPPLVVADEPTGNLDARTSAEVFDLFARLAREGKTLVMVTHNDELARQASRVLEIVNGQIVRDQTGSPGIS
jgi:putative ABC transport system ATP-binding protein